jgi:hypothetical protein
MLLMQDPELLMLDQPVAGMSTRERDQTAELLKCIAQNPSILIIEHDIGLCERGWPFHGRHPLLTGRRHARALLHSKMEECAILSAVLLFLYLDHQPRTQGRANGSPKGESSTDWPIGTTQPTPLASSFEQEVIAPTPPGNPHGPGNEAVNGEVRGDSPICPTRHGCETRS